MPDKTTGKQPEDLKEDDLDRAQGGFAPLKPAELVTGEPLRNPGFYVPEVDDEVVV